MFIEVKYLTEDWIVGNTEVCDFAGLPETLPKLHINIETIKAETVGGYFADEFGEIRIDGETE